MLNNIIKRECARSRHLATLFGPYLDDYLTELRNQGYKETALRSRLGAVTRFGEYLALHGVRAIIKIGESNVRGFISAEQRCRTRVRKADTISRIKGITRKLLRFLQSRGAIVESKATPQPQGPIHDFLQELDGERGLHAKTIDRYRLSLDQFLQHIGSNGSASDLSRITTQDVDSFMVSAGHRWDRSSMRAICTALRGMLRHLHETGLQSRDLSLTVSMPMFYAMERLPCAVPWETINDLLQLPDRTTNVGRRDRAVLQLLIAYAIRPGELVQLRLNDIDWQREQIVFSRSKPGRRLRFDLTQEVGEVILAYLREARPSTSQRNVFMTARAPFVPLNAKAVYMIVRRYVEKVGIDARIKGPYLIRHSLAVHLVRQGQPLKTVTDILGHRDPHVGYHYTKLATEDLRDVALSTRDVLP
jgi:integrase/recombinase XerD